jgi:hypothetical protein
MKTIPVVRSLFAFLLLMCFIGCFSTGFHVSKWYLLSSTERQACHETFEAPADRISNQTRMACHEA